MESTRCSGIIENIIDATNGFLCTKYNGFTFVAISEILLEITFKNPNHYITISIGVAVCEHMPDMPTQNCTANGGL